MFRYLRIAVLCLIAVGALSVATAASASAAEPALYECAKLKKSKTTKKYEGKYNNKTCSEENAKGEGKYELKEGIGKGKPFKGTGVGSNLELKGGGGVSCKASKDTGKFTSPKTAGDVVAIFTGCEANHAPCTSSGAKTGEIKTNALKGEVGYIEGGKAKHEVGVALTAETGTYEAEFKCGTETEMRVSGSVIGLVTTAPNKFTKEATLLFQETAGIQAITKLEGGPTDVLSTETRANGGAWGAPIQSGESDKVTNKGEELELKA